MTCCAQPNDVQEVFKKFYTLQYFRKKIGLEEWAKVYQISWSSVHWQYPRYCKILLQKLTKIGKELLCANIPHHATFHCAQPQNVRVKCNILHPSVFWRPRGIRWANVHQYWPWWTAKPYLVNLPNYVDFAEDVSNKKQTMWRQEHEDMDKT